MILYMLYRSVPEKNQVFFQVFFHKKIAFFLLPFVIYYNSKHLIHWKKERALFFASSIHGLLFIM